MEVYEELSLVRKANIEAFEEIKRRLLNHKLTIAKNDTISNKLELYTEVDTMIEKINTMIFKEKPTPTKPATSEEILNRIING